MLHSGHWQSSLRERKVSNISYVHACICVEKIQSVVCYMAYVIWPLCFTDYRLVVICSKEDEEKSHIIYQLHNFERPEVPKLDERRCKEYLKTHFTLLPANIKASFQAVPTGCAATVVDPDKLVTLFHPHENCHTTSVLAHKKKGKRVLAPERKKNIYLY